MKKLLFTLLLLSSYCFCFSQSYDFSEIVTNIKKSIDPQNTIDIKDPAGWLTPSNPKIWPDRVVTSIFKAEAGEYEIKGYNRDKNDGSWDSLILTINPSASSGKKNIPYNIAYNLYDNLKRAFGEPARLVNYGFLQQSSTNQNCKAQWDIGNFVISFNSDDVDYIIGKPSIMWSYLRIVKKSDIEPIVPLIGVRFTPVAAEFIKEGYERSFTEGELIDMGISFIIDYNNKDILRMDYTFLGKIESVTALQIVFLVKGPKGNPGIRATIDRYDGGMSYILYDSQTGEAVISAKGKAEEVDIGKRKF